MKEILALFKPVSYRSRKDTFKVGFYELKKLFFKTVDDNFLLYIGIIYMGITMILQSSAVITLSALAICFVLSFLSFYYDDVGCKQYSLKFTIFDILLIPIMLFFSVYFLPYFILKATSLKLIYLSNRILKIEIL